MYWTLVNGNAPDSWARWQAAVSPNGGIYEVFVYIPSTNMTMTWQAPYTVRYNNNTLQTTARVDEYGSGNRWVSIGTYYMTNNDYVFATDATAETYGVHCGASTYCKVGVDAIKFVRRGSAYLPYLNTSDGWNDTITIRNDGGGPGDVYISVFDEAGSLRCSLFIQVPGQSILSSAVTSTSCPPAKSARVDAGQDVAVVVREQNATGQELDAYNGILASGGSLGWERVGSTVYVPLIKNARYGRSSKLFIMNAGPQSTVASVQFYNSDTGDSMGNPSTSLLNVNASVPVNAGNCTGTTNRCSAKITSSSGLSLAVIVREQDDVSTNNRVTYSGFSSGATQNFAPIVKRNRYGRTTGLVIENVGTGTASTDISVKCYDLTGGSYPNCGSYTGLASKATFVLTPLNVPDNFVGSAFVTSNGQPIVTAIYESGSPYQQAANAPLIGTMFAYAPELYGNYGMGGQTWDSGIAIQNAGLSNATVTVTYYNQSGTQAGQWTTPTPLQPNRVWILNRASGNLPNNFAGSAVITANQPVVAIANHSHTGSGDTNASYTVPNR
jgi:hypothetical protein